MGREAYARLLYDAGYRSAHFWCESESATHGLQGLAVFEPYLMRLSQRGWGRFSFTSVEPERGLADIRLEFSSFVLASPQQRGRLCYMFSGWFAGAMDWVLEQQSSPQRSSSLETRCGGEGHPDCSFAVRPRDVDPLT